MTITPEQIAEARAVNSERTPGTWDWSGDRRGGSSVRGPDDELLATTTSYDHQSRDRDAIVLAVNMLGPLLDEVERLQKLFAFVSGSVSPPTMADHRDLVTYACETVVAARMSAIRLGQRGENLREAQVYMEAAEKTAVAEEKGTFNG